MISASPAPAAVIVVPSAEILTTASLLERYVTFSLNDVSVTVICVPSAQLYFSSEKPSSAEAISGAAVTSIAQDKIPAISFFIFIFSSTPFKIHFCTILRYAPKNVFPITPLFSFRNRQSHRKQTTASRREAQPCCSRFRHFYM